MKHYVPVLSIAGSDSSGGAGIQADIKTMASLGCYAMTAITAITCQNTTGVTAIMPATPSIVGSQIDAVFDDIRPMAVKTGMLFDSDIIATVAERMRRYEVSNLVVDPVMISTSGSQLITDDAIEYLRSNLLPLATVVTPNLNEAIRLTGHTDPQEQMRILREMGCRTIVLKGGDADTGDYKIDYLMEDGSDRIIPLKADKVLTQNTHGTGCTFSSAIASYLAMGCPTVKAVMLAKHYITRALRAGANVTIGHGHGPVNHSFSPRHAKIIKK